MPKDQALRILKIVSNPIRKSIIQSLRGTSMIFSDIMRACGLNPNHDTGPFFYHLSMLSGAGMVEKKGNEYRLTSFGNTIAAFVESLHRESRFLLDSEEPEKGSGRRLGDIQAHWLAQQEAGHGEYGILWGGPRRPPLKPEETPYAAPEDKPKHEELWEWIESLPKLTSPPAGFSGYVLGFEKNGVKLGSIHARLSTGSEIGTRKVIAIAKILTISVLSQGCKEIKETRASVIRQMMEEFTRQAREHHVQTIVVERASAEDEDLINVLKELGYERYMTTYLMRTTISP